MAGKAAEKGREIQQIAKDVACEYCGLLVDDMWSMVVQNQLAGQVRAPSG